MNVEQAIKGRRSERAYLPKKVPRRLVLKVIDSARWAPSLHNLQPWQVIIAEGAVKQRLVDSVSRPYSGFDPLMVRLPLKQFIHVLKLAPVAILVYNTRPFSRKLKGLSKPLYQCALVWENHSIGACIQNMLLTAHGLGLGSTWFGIPLVREKHIDKALKTGHELAAIITLGYLGKRSKPPMRKNLSEVLKVIK